MEFDEQSVHVEATDPWDTDTAEAFDIYVVQSEDTYYDIARKLNMTAVELHALNPLIDPDAIVPGERLRFPLMAGEDAAVFSPLPQAAPAPQAAPVPAPQPVPLPQPLPVPEPAPKPLPAPEPLPRPVPTVPPQTIQTCPVNHIRITLPPGWDFCQVLRRYDISYQALCNANPRVNVESMRAGQVLCIPPADTCGICKSEGMNSYVIERGDTLDTMAQTAGTTDAALLRANPNLSPGDFVPGRVVCMPK